MTTDLVRSVTEPLLTAGAAVALALVGAGAPLWVAAPLALLVWLVILQRSVQTIRRSGPSGLIGTQVPSRLLLLATLGLTLGSLQEATTGRVLTWIGAALLLAVVASEPVLKRLVPEAEAVNVPGWPDRTTPGPADLLGPVVLLVLGAGWLLPLLAAGPVIWAVAAVVAVLLCGVAGVGGWLHRRSRATRRRALRSALDRMAPVVAIYTARGPEGNHQVEMWLPPLAAVGVQTMIITRRPDTARALARRTDLPIVCGRQWRDLDDVVPDSLAVVGYVNTLGENAHLVSNRGLTHVYLGHGESDKALSHHPSHRMYDRIFVAGEAAVDRYAEHGVEIAADQCVRVGRPQVAAITRAEGDRAQPPVALYTPTWGGYNAGTDYSSLRHGTVVVQALLDAGCVVHFRPHPFSRGRRGERNLVDAVDALLRRDLRQSGRAHRWGPTVDEATFAACANVSDLLISDLSSVTIDYLASDKPIVLVLPTGKDPEQFRRESPSGRSAYLTDASPDSVRGALDEALTNDPLAPARHAVRTRYLGADPQAAEELFVHAVREMITCPSGRAPKRTRGPSESGS